MTARALATAKRHGTGWTGGQYSAARVLLGASVAWHLASRIADGPAAGSRAVLTAGVAAALLAAAGVRTRTMLAALLAGLATLRVLAPEAPAGGVALAVLLAAHLLAPAAPYGSWDARAQAASLTEWPRPVAAASIAWLGAWGTSAAVAGPWWIGAAAGTLLLTVPPLAVVRPWAWAGLVALWIAGAARGSAAPDVFALQLLVLSLDPAWIPPRWPSRTDRIFYDGTCALCHGAIRFLLAEDRTGKAFTFGPLHGRTWHATVPAAARAQLPDSVIVQTADGHLYARTAAVVYVLERLGGLWRVPAAILGLVPRRLGDAVYDAVARVRGRVFGRIPAGCPLPADLRSRLVD